MTKGIHTYRDALMGMAAVAVVLTHCGIQSSQWLIHDLCYYGYLGVDFFLFLSGFGLYRSLSQGKSIWSFFGRRIRRIYPVWVHVLLLWIADLWCMGWISGWKDAADLIAGHLLGYLHYTGSDETLWFNWYILALPLYYLMAPVFAKVIQKWKGWGCLFLLAVSFSILPFFWGRYIQMRLFSRFPVYILGFWFGSLDLKQTEETGTSGWKELLWITAAFAWTSITIYFAGDHYDFYSMYGLWWWPFAFAVPEFCLLLGKFFSVLKNVSGVIPVLTILGAASFEIYLVHIKIFFHVKEWFPDLSDKTWILLILAVLVLGCMYHWFMQKVMKKRQTDPHSSIQNS